MRREFSAMQVPHGLNFLDFAYHSACVGLGITHLPSLHPTILVQVEQAFKQHVEELESQLGELRQSFLGLSEAQVTERPGVLQSFWTHYSDS